MPLSMNSNIASLTVQRNLLDSTGNLNKVFAKLSTGSRINTASDDAAGLAIAERMTAQVRGLGRAVHNANDGISVAQVAEGALAEQENILQRMHELTVQAANETYTTGDRQDIQAEIAQMLDELDRIANDTEFNGWRMLNGATLPLVFQVGAKVDQTVTVQLADARAATLLAQPALADPNSKESLKNPKIKGLLIPAPATPLTNSKLFSSTVAIGINAVASAASSGSSPWTTDPAKVAESMITAFGGNAAAITAATANIAASSTTADIQTAAAFITAADANLSTNQAAVIAAAVYQANQANATTSTAAIVTAIGASSETSRVIFDAVSASSALTYGVRDTPTGNLNQVVNAIHSAIVQGKDVEAIAQAARDADAGKTLSSDIAKVIAAGAKAAAVFGVTVAYASTAADNMARVLNARDAAVTYASQNIQPTANETLMVPEWLLDPTSTLNRFPSSPLVDLTGATIATDPTIPFDPPATDNANPKLTGPKAASRMLAIIAKAIDRVSAIRSELGAVENRFNVNIQNLSNVVENISAARGRIQDTDIAAESANQARLSIIQQAGVAILAQANQQPQLILQLLK
ncbi:MAG: hypothetical protein HQM03_18590 [Magnetococcales bacterium]|nr:hypothetical protein [Magnetococcales bacterium]